MAFATFIINLSLVTVRSDRIGSITVYSNSFEKLKNGFWGWKEFYQAIVVLINSKRSLKQSCHCEWPKKLMLKEEKQEKIADDVIIGRR